MTLVGSPFQEKVLDFFRRRLAESEGYEHRTAQLEMTAAVAQAIEKEEILVVEAGTGTGKSLAYLVPSLLWGAYSKKPVVVSTRTLNLQQQIVCHDLPRLQGLLSFVPEVAQARGWSNYVCLRRLASLPGSGVPVEVEEQAVSLTHHLSHGGSGIRQDLEVSGELWSRVHADSAACGRQGCPYYEDCYLFADRKKLERADLIVTNHSLVMADLALKREGAPGILPGYACLVLDEGHHLEEVATQHLGRSFGSFSFAQLINQLYDGAGLEKGGYLPLVRERVARSPLDASLKQTALKLVDHELLALIPAVQRMADEFFEAVAFTLAKHDGKMQLAPEDFESEGGQELRRLGAEVAGGLAALARGCDQLVAELSETEMPGVQELRSELAGYQSRLKQMTSDLEFCLFPDSEDWVYWAQDSSRDTALVATPLEVGEILKRDLFEQARSLVICSATLAVNKSLEFFQERVGLTENPRLQGLCLESPFNFPEQVYLGVATALGNPGTPDYREQVVPALIELVERLRGRTFLLVTSWSLLRQMEADLGPPLAERGIGVLTQGQASGAALLEKFRGQGDYLLIGTDSFWEGVDVPGEALSCVVLARLPFRVPTDPVVSAHSKRLQRRGQDPFRNYQLPLAILKLRQGFGRLVRTARDRGLVLVLDHRARTKAYGRDFLQSLPPCRRRAGPVGGLVLEALDWLETQEEDSGLIKG